MIHTLSFDIFQLFCFQVRLTAQILRWTMVVHATGFPTILVDLLNLLGYRLYISLVHRV